jgi:hypothetical protein
MALAGPVHSRANSPICMMLAPPLPLLALNPPSKVHTHMHYTNKQKTTSAHWALLGPIQVLLISVYLKTKFFSEDVLDFDAVCKLFIYISSSYDFRTIVNTFVNKRKIFQTFVQYGYGTAVIFRSGKNFRTLSSCFINGQAFLIFVNYVLALLQILRLFHFTVNPLVHNIVSKVCF